jgi:hypothetical protein
MSDNDQQRPETSYDVPDRTSSISPEDLFADGMPATLTCDDCGADMPVKSGTESVVCDCGHDWQVRCSTGVME